MKTAAAAAAAGTWTSLTSKIHPPLPMSPRDSQRLLSLLNASFKEQLDREHTTASSSNEHHATNHLRRILTNPLFDAKSQTPAYSGSRSVQSGKLLGQRQDNMKRPMDDFKHQISRGVANLNRATFSLHRQYEFCSASPAATPRIAMQTSGAASTILQWLWASGMEDTLEFLKNKPFVSSFVPFLVAEGQHFRVRRWLHQCHSSDETVFTSLPESNTEGMERERIESHLLTRLVKEETRCGDGLDSAINIFIRTVAGLDNARLTKSSKQDIAGQAAWALTRSICFQPQVPMPKATTVRRFVETMRTFNEDPLLNAFVCVYVQKWTEPQAALTFFQNTSCEVFLPMSAQARCHILLLGVRAAELFLQNRRQTEALWIMGYLRKNFAEELGLPLEPVRKSLSLNEQATLSEEEERSLHLLDTIAV